MLSWMLKSGTLNVWNSLKVLNDRSWRDSGSVLLSYLSEDLVGHYLGRASFLVLREFLSGILTAGSRHEIMISDAPQHEWEAEDGKLGERGVYQRIYHQLSGDVPPSPFMRDCSVGLSLPDAQWAPPSPLPLIRCSATGRSGILPPSVMNWSCFLGDTILWCGSHWNRWIPHDNIHEINTWKCPIQTQCG